MKKLISCESSIDTACVELRYTDGMLISTDCTKMEYEAAHTAKQRYALDHLLYNARKNRHALYVLFTLPRLQGLQCRPILEAKKEVSR